MSTEVQTVYTPTLNVSVSSKSGVTLWTTGNPASMTVRFPTGTAIAGIAPTVKVAPKARKRS